MGDKNYFHYFIEVIAKFTFVIIFFYLLGKYKFKEV